MRRVSEKNKQVRDTRTNDIFYTQSRQQQFREKLARDASNGGDTNLRIELQAKIREAVCEGKSREEVISEISQEEKFKRYEQFFETWVDHQINNYNKAQKGKLPIRPGYDSRENMYVKHEDNGEAR